jgi:hypothetical protein
VSASFRYRLLFQWHCYGIAALYVSSSLNVCFAVDAEAAGARQPFVTLPYWLLWVLVRVAVMLSIVCHTIFCGLQILHPKTGARHDHFIVTSRFIFLCVL